MDLSRIKNKQFVKKIYEIATNDGGKSHSEIDSEKGFEELGKLLGQGLNGKKLSSDERDVVLGLCIEYQSKTGSDNTANNGDNIVVSGRNNITTGRITNSNVIVGNNNQIVVNNSENVKNKHKIKSSFKMEGATLAKLLFEETVNSFYADNDAIVDISKRVNNKNAYSFFKEYQRLSSNKSNIVQDIYAVSDIFDRITLNETLNMVNSLLSQAEGIGLKGSDAYNNLKNFSKNIEHKRNKDPTKNEGIKLDYAIQILLDEMSKVYGNK